MRVRTSLALAGLAALLLVPLATAGPHGAVVASANGAVHWTIPLPNAFGVEVVSKPLAFDVKKYADGSVSGHFFYRQIAGGDTFKFKVDATCMNVYDGGHRAKIGGVVTKSTDVTEPPGTFAWFQVFDNGHGDHAAPDQSSLVGFGDEAANEAFCNSPNLPRFGPWDVQGNVDIRS